MRRSRLHRHRRRADAICFDLQVSVFIVLVTVAALERIATPSVLVLGTCQQHVAALLGPVPASDGIHDMVRWVALAAIALIVLDQMSVALLRRARRLMASVWAMVNLLVSLTLLGLWSSTWAFYNVDTPTADRIYAAHSSVYNITGQREYFTAPSMAPQSAAVVAIPRQLDPRLWRCAEAECGADPNQTVFYHQTRALTARNMRVSTCHSPAFNRAILAAIDVDESRYTGENERWALIFFDGEGRYIRPETPAIETAYLQRQFAAQGIRPSPVTIDRLSEQLYEDSVAQDAIAARAVRHEAAATPQ